MLESRKGLYALYEIFNWKHIANNQILRSEKLKCSLKIWNLLLRWQIVCSLSPKVLQSFVIALQKYLREMWILPEKSSSKRPLPSCLCCSFRKIENGFTVIAFTLIPSPTPQFHQEEILLLKGWCKPRTTLLTSQRRKWEQNRDNCF